MLQYIHSLNFVLLTMRYTKPIHFIESQGFIHDIHPMGSTFVNALRLFLITT